MAWVKKIVADDLWGTTYDYHVIRGINLPAWDRTKGLTGWGQGGVIIDSYISRDNRLAGMGPFKSSIHLVDFTLFPTIDWNGQDNLLTWAYTTIKSATEFADATDDLAPGNGEVQ